MLVGTLGGYALASARPEVDGDHQGDDQNGDDDVQRPDG